MPRLVFMQGIPGSGKRMYVERLLQSDSTKWNVICRDDYREALGYGYGQRTTLVVEKKIAEMFDIQIKALMLRGRDIILKECMVREKYVLKYVDMIRQFNEEKRLSPGILRLWEPYTIKIIRMVTPKQICAKRRPAPFPISVIDDMWNSLENEGVACVDNLIIKNGDWIHLEQVHFSEE